MRRRYLRSAPGPRGWKLLAASGVLFLAIGVFGGAFIDDGVPVTDAHAVVATVRVGLLPSGVEVVPRGEWLYVADRRAVIGLVGVAVVRVGARPYGGRRG